MNRNRTSWNRRDSLVSITRVDSSIEVPKARAEFLMHYLARVSTFAFLAFCRLLVRAPTSKTRSMILRTTKALG